MAFTPSEVEEISAAVRQVYTQPCSVCGRADAFGISDEGFVMLTLQDNAHSLRLGGSALPCIAFICTHCGKTDLLNAIVLGLSRLVEQYSSAEAAPAG